MARMRAKKTRRRDPQNFEDPDTFKPERWLRPDPKTGEFARVRRPDEYLLPVFWAGARLCLGKDMARFEVIMVASMTASGTPVPGS